MFRKLSVRTSIALARTSLFSAFAVLLLTSPALSQSISIPIPNYDFASPYVPDLSPFAEAGVSNWVQSPPPAWWTADGYSTVQWDDNVGVFVNVPSEWIDNLVPSGGTAVHQQAAFMFSAPGLELSQTLSTAYQVGASYQLTVGIEGGGEGMPLGVPMQIELYYLDGSGNQVPVGTTTVLNDLTLNPYMGQYITRFARPPVDHTGRRRRRPLGGPEHRRCLAPNCRHCKYRLLGYRQCAVDGDNCP